MSKKLSLISNPILPNALFQFSGEFYYFLTFGAGVGARNLKDMVLLLSRLKMDAEQHIWSEM